MNQKTHEYLRKLASESDWVMIPSHLLYQLLHLSERLGQVESELDHWKEELFAARDRILGGDEDGGPYR